MIISQKFKNRYKKALLLTEIYNLKKKSNSTIPFFIVYRNCPLIHTTSENSKKKYWQELSTFKF